MQIPKLAGPQPTSLCVLHNLAGAYYAQMRIGIALEGERLAAAAVTADGRVFCRNGHEAAPDLASAVSSLLRDLLRCSSAEAVVSVAFDVSGALSPARDRETMLIRIAPRPPLDDAHEASHAPTSIGPVPIVHAAGGHDALGEELVPLDEAALCAAALAADRGGRFVITSVGSHVNPAHEVRAGEILLEHADPESIEYSHSFATGAFAIRERTALANAAIAPDAAAIATALALAAGDVAPAARLYVATNDGGSAPLARLARRPVHSMLSGPASELSGAAALCGVEAGHLIVAGHDGAFLGEIASGVPTVVPRRLDRSGSTMATQTAHLLPVREVQRGARGARPLVVAHGPADFAAIIPEADIDRRCVADLRALGAACAPLSEWETQMVGVADGRAMERALQAAEARVRARLAAAGAAPSHVRILESRAVATAYERSRVISVRVRGVAGAQAGPLSEVTPCS